MVTKKVHACLFSLITYGFLTQASWALDVKLEVVAEGLTAPMMLVSPPDGTKRRFIVEQIGVIRILTPDGKLLDEPFLNIRHKIAPLFADFDEEGLYSLAFHPDYKSNGKFYVAYAGPIRGEASYDKQFWYAHTNYVAEYHVSKDNPNKADGQSERIVMANEWPQFNHNGHWLGFGHDGYLYISTGDGGYANDWGIGHNVVTGNGQDLNSLLGKMLRIDVNKGEPYGVPKDNPFIGKADARQEIWAYGFRNPWRCSFDTHGKHELICADVGQNSYEEVDVVKKGGNYGWRVMEGTHCFDYVNPNKHLASCNNNGMTPPIIEYKNCNVFQDCKGISIIGGYVYRGHHRPWHGKYFFGDWSLTFAVKDGRLFVASEKDGKWTMEDVKVSNMAKFNSYVLGFGQDAEGEVYVMSTDTRGPVGGLDKVYKIVP